MKFSILKGLGISITSVSFLIDSDSELLNTIKGISLNVKSQIDIFGDVVLIIILSVKVFLIGVFEYFVLKNFCFWIFRVKEEFFGIFICFSSKIFLKSNTASIDYATSSIFSDIGSNLIVWQSSKILLIMAGLLFPLNAKTCTNVRV